jgi:hypothetical protein
VLKYGTLHKIHSISITFTKSSPLCVTTFSASLTNFTVFLPPPNDCSYHVSRILAPPLLGLQKHTDPRAHQFAHSPDLWLGLGPLTLPAPEARDFKALIQSLYRLMFVHKFIFSVKPWLLFGNFRLVPLCKWDLRPSGMLPSTDGSYRRFGTTYPSYLQG